ncbi:MAG: hypothetical protein PHO56_02155 [Patescibacteria group bacterium]|nr:hypothetical protein [Patescibacteria group bacterium]
MTARIRPTVPYNGIYPHREHRSPKGRDKQYHKKKFEGGVKRQKKEIIKELECEEELNNLLK